MSHFSKILILVVLVFPKLALGMIDLGISGSTSTSNFSLETHKSTALSANVSVGIGYYFHIGLTHRRAFENKYGLKKASSSDDVFIYLPFEDHTESVTNSVDLTLFLYHGQFSPFIFGGVAKRDYFTEIEFQNQKVKSQTTLFPVPNYGFGVAIRLSMRFQLKISQTYTPGIRTILEEGEEVSSAVNDSYTQLGISYRL